MDDFQILLLVYACCLAFLLVVIVGVRLIFPPLPKMELNEFEREYITRSNREKP